MLQPSSEARSVFLLHRDKPHTHAILEFAPLDDGTSPYLSCRHIKE
jgi:hypothetical protein